MKHTENRVIDGSRYRTAEAIAEQWIAGDPSVSIGKNYFENSVRPDLQTWVVELIVAAYDRKGTFEPKETALD